VKKYKPAYARTNQKVRGVTHQNALKRRNI